MAGSVEGVVRRLRVVDDAAELLDADLETSPGSVRYGRRARTGGVRSLALVPDGPLCDELEDGNEGSAMKPELSDDVFST